MSGVYAVVVLAAMGALWMFVNIRTNRRSNLKTVSLLLMWLFLLSSSALAIRLAWEWSS